MVSKYSVSLAKIIKEFSLESVYLPGDPADIAISSGDVNRPGLFINGFYEYFDADRIQLLGKMEMAYLEDLPGAPMCSPSCCPPPRSMACRWCVPRNPPPT